VVVSGSRGVYDKVELNGHHLSSSRSDTRLVSTAPARYPRDRLAPRPAARSQIIQNMRVEGIPDRRAPLIDRRVPITDRRAAPVDRRPPPIDRRALPVDRRAQIERRTPINERRPTLVERREQPMDRRLPAGQTNEWRSSTIISNTNQTGARETGTWNEQRRAYDQGDKPPTSSRRSQDAQGLQARRPAALEVPSYGRRSQDSLSSRDILQPQGLRERATPQYREDATSQQYMDRGNRISTTRTLGRQQDARRLPLELDERMDQRSARQYIERVNVGPTSRGQMVYDEKRMPPAPLQRRNIYDDGQRGPELRGPVPTREHDQGDRSRGRKRRWEESKEKNQPRESLFIMRRMDRGGDRARY